VFTSGHAYSDLLAALCGFLLLVAIIRHYAPRSVLPAESWLLLAGIGYGLLAPQVSALPPVRLDPELVVSVLLPVLVFASGRRLPVHLMLRSIGPISLLVLTGTPLAMVLIGLPTGRLLDV
jgi:NhaP-type Na+/H+ or K+/H+ antiporter